MSRVFHGSRTCPWVAPGGFQKVVGRVGTRRVGSGRVGSGRVGSGRVGSGRVGSGQVVFEKISRVESLLSDPIREK